MLASSKAMFGWWWGSGAAPPPIEARRPARLLQPARPVPHAGVRPGRQRGGRARRAPAGPDGRSRSRRPGLRRCELIAALAREPYVMRAQDYGSGGAARRTGLRGCWDGWASSGWSSWDVAARCPDGSQPPIWPLGLPLFPTGAPAAPGPPRSRQYPAGSCNAASHIGPYVIPSKKAKLLTLRTPPP